jgi:hypothetical protein
MIKNKVIGSTLCLMLFFHAWSFAQEAVPTTGGEALGAGGTVSYTIGQVAYNTYSSASNSEAQGVQQPYEISVVTSIYEQVVVGIECNVFPNPSTRFLQLQIEGDNLEEVTYQLYDVSGKLLEINQVDARLTTINMEKYVSATYLLYVRKENQTMQTFKIIKNEN